MAKEITEQDLLAMNLHEDREELIGGYLTVIRRVVGGWEYITIVTDHVDGEGTVDIGVTSTFVPERPKPNLPVSV